MVIFVSFHITTQMPTSLVFMAPLKSCQKLCACRARLSFHYPSVAETPRWGVFPVGGLLGAAQREDSPLDDWRTYSFAENLGGTWKAFLLHQVMWEE